MGKLFGTNGIRGVFSDDFTLEFTLMKALDDTYCHMRLSKGGNDLPYVLCSHKAVP